RVRPHPLAEVVGPTSVRVRRVRSRPPKSPGRGSPAEVPEPPRQSPGPPLQAVPNLAGEHSRLLTGGPVAFGSEGLCASCELACQRRLLLFSPCDLLTEVYELVACAVDGGSGLIAFAFDLSQPVLGQLLQRRPLGHCVLVFTPGLCEFTPGLCDFAAGAHPVPGLLGGDLFGFADRRDVELLGPDVLPDSELGTGRGGVVSAVADRGGVVSA